MVNSMMQAWNGGIPIAIPAKAQAEIAALREDGESEHSGEESQKRIFSLPQEALQRPKAKQKVILCSYEKSL